MTQLQLDRTIFKMPDGTIKCTQYVMGKRRVSGLKMRGDVAKFKNGIIKLWWKDKWYVVPDETDFIMWSIDSICLTPDGDQVEPDHEDSWLALAQLV